MNYFVTPIGRMDLWESLRQTLLYCAEQGQYVLAVYRASESCCVVVTA